MSQRYMEGRSIGEIGQKGKGEYGDMIK